MSVSITNDNKNLLLERREITCVFKDTRNLKRQNAIQLVKDKLKSENDLIIPIRLLCSSGLNEINGVFYIYNNKTEAEKQINRHILTRLIKNDK